MGRQRSFVVLAAALFLISVLRRTPDFVPAASGERSLTLRGYSALRGSSAGLTSAPAGLSLGVCGLPFVGLFVAASARLASALKGASPSNRSESLQVLRATRSEWYRKVKRLGGDKALFDVTIKKPLGIRLADFPQADRTGCGVFEVLEGSNTDVLNRKVIVDDEPGMWVLEGDQIIAVDGVECEDADVNGVTQLVASNTKEEVTLTLLRNTRLGPVRVVMMPEGLCQTVRRNSRLSAAAEFAAGRELKYGCIDGWCGTCWHRERATNGVFKPCCDLITTDWDNVMPLVLTPKPEKAGDATYLKPRGAE